MMRLALFLVLTACGAPKQPAVTNDLDTPPRPIPVEEPVDAAVVIDASPPGASLPDARARSSDETACEDDPAAKQACESMGVKFAPRLVLPCHRGDGAPVKPVPRCMCVDTSKPRNCP